MPFIPHTQADVQEMLSTIGVAKIEDFDVLPKYQRKGYGSALLKEIICIALEQNARIIYLVTDEDDTAKEMYLKIGFEKVGEKTQLFFTL